MTRRPRREPGGDDGRVVGGVHPVRELLRAGEPLHRVLLAGGPDPRRDELRRLAAAVGVPVEPTGRARLDELTGGLTHQGVAALAPRFPTTSLAAVLDAADRAGEPPLLVALDGVTDPHNLGSIARTAEAVGAHGLLLPGRRAAGITPAAEKAAAGALAYLPVAVVTNLVRALTELHERGVWSLGLDGSAEVVLAEHPLAGEGCVLVVGAEGDGLARLTRERCDGLVRLPMWGRIASLNASVAAGVALYELRRARSTTVAGGE